MWCILAATVSLKTVGNTELPERNPMFAHFYTLKLPCMVIVKFGVNLVITFKAMTITMSSGGQFTSSRDIQLFALVEYWVLKVTAVVYFLICHVQYSPMFSIP